MQTQSRQRGAQLVGHVGSEEPLAIERQVQARHQLVNGRTDRLYLRRGIVEHNRLQVIRGTDLQLPLQIAQRTGDELYRLHADEQGHADNKQARYQQASNRLMHLALNMRMVVVLVDSALHQQLDLLFALMP